MQVDFGTIVGRKVSIRAVSDNDFDMLCQWFSDPDVFEFWGGKPLRREVVAEKYLGRRPHVACFIIEEMAQPIGYIQAWKDHTGNGLDMFPLKSARDRGLGPDASRTLAAQLYDSGWRNITVDPAESNARAIRAYQKAGFSLNGERQAKTLFLFLADKGLF